MSKVTGAFSNSGATSSMHGSNTLGLGAESLEARIVKQLTDAGMYDPGIPLDTGSNEVREAALVRRGQRILEPS